MILHCPECDAVVRAVNINVHAMTAVCQECNAAFSFDMADVGGREKDRKYAKAPAQLTITDDENGLIVAYQQVLNEDETRMLFSNSVIAAVMTAAMFLLLLLGSPVWMVGGLALVALAGWYALAAMRLNTTTITLTATTLQVSKGPLPWFTGASNRAFERATIADVTITETRTSRQTGGVRRFYHVRVQQPDGHAITILPGLPQAYARYIVHKITAALRAEEAEDDFDYDHLDELAESLAEDILADTGELTGGELPGFLDGQSDS